ncbi:MAG: single-stranded DNA-binding protein [Bacteroidales bacterium]|nr:single-stranded DNA-binding protein [Bacteroidales bacterium]
MGRLTRDPEIRSTNTGAQVALFSIAVDRKPSLKKGDESKENTDFFSITAWDKLAGFAENYLKQGTKVLILGHLQNDSYNDKNGNKVVRTKIVAESIEFCESKNSGAAPVAKAGEDFLNVPDDESLPFSF